MGSIRGWVGLVLGRKPSWLVGFGSRIWVGSLFFWVENLVGSLFFKV